MIVATLHVRNVPDGLYEALRARAEREGRSIGSQTCVLLEQALLVEPLRVPSRHGRGVPLAPSERFAPPARDAVAQAAREAAALGHDAIETEDLLLALLADEGSVASHLLGVLGVDRGSVMERLGEVPSPKRRRSAAPLPFAPAVKEVLELALRESLARGGPAGTAAIDSEDILIALAAYGEGRAAHSLRDLGVEASTVRAAAVRLRGGAGPQPAWFGPFATATAWEYQTLDLTGDSKAWSQQLNDAASEGWELFSVTESETPRAILRRVAGFSAPAPDA